MKHIFLGSSSPRRLELMKNAFPQTTIDVLKPSFDESFPKNLKTEEVAIYIAKQKAMDIQKNHTIRSIPLITADTIVALEDKIIGKPANKEEAIETLELLSGKKHKVHTGVCIVSSNEYHTFIETTEVYFDVLKRKDIEFYIKNYKPMDKAGSYGIQEFIGLIGIEKIEGCFYNVIGLPINQLKKRMTLLNL